MALLRQVVALDLYRILSQLRSRHAKRTRKATGKPPLILLLNDERFKSNLSLLDGERLVTILHTAHVKFAQ